MAIQVIWEICFVRGLVLVQLVSILLSKIAHMWKKNMSKDLIHNDQKLSSYCNGSQIFDSFDVGVLLMQ